METFCIWQKEAESGEMRCFAQVHDGPMPEGFKKYSQCPKTIEDVEFRGVKKDRFQFSIGGCLGFELREDLYINLANKFLPKKCTHNRNNDRIYRYK